MLGASMHQGQRANPWVVVCLCFCESMLRHIFCTHSYKQMLALLSSLVRMTGTRSRGSHVKCKGAFLILLSNAACGLFCSKQDDDRLGVVIRLQKGIHEKVAKSRRQTELFGARWKAGLTTIYMHLFESLVSFSLSPPFFAPFFLTDGWARLFFLLNWQIN